jgi:N-acyl-D-aspartate/D-glutamate deacylase
MRLTGLFIATWLLSLPLLAENLVLVNGTVIDGTGKARTAGSVRIRDGKIADIGVFKAAPSETQLDVKGLVVAPGFIDLESSDVNSAALRGVTTVILGSDGKGPYAIEDFMVPFDEKPPVVNIAMLAGHGTIRRQIIGADYKRAATASEIGLMSQLLRDAMSQGAFGVASDLRSEPASFSNADELTGLANVLGQFGGTLFIHPHDEMIQGPLDVARNAKITIEFSLDKISAGMIGDLNKARMQGVDVGAHVYSLLEPAADLKTLLQNPMIAISYAQYVQDDKGTTLERAIQKLTSLPASRVSLRERGSLRKGMPADIVVFNPMAASHSITYVFVNGTMVVKDGQATDARPGQALR